MSEPDPWLNLRSRTAARIALGRAGGSLPTRAQLAFRWDHAQARDAVLTEFDPEAFAQRLRGLHSSVLVLETAAQSRSEYLQNPELGRRLTPFSASQLCPTGPLDLVIIVSNGLSTLAVDTQAYPVLEFLLPALRQRAWQLAPILVCANARVALQDPIGEQLQARLSLILLGERPGLASADSLGAYFTFRPKVGTSDSARNCVSNIRAGGIPPAAAAEKLVQLLERSRALKLSGVGLKDETSARFESRIHPPLPET